MGYDIKNLLSCSKLTLKLSFDTDLKYILLNLLLYVFNESRTFFVGVELLFIE